MSQYQFSEYYFNDKTGSLSKDGHVVSLRVKNAQLLLLLLKSDNQLCSKESLYNELWADTIVQDNSLAKCINELRLALGDSAKESIYIKTWPKKGYQFLPKVTQKSKFKAGKKLNWLLATLSLIIVLYFGKELITEQRVDTTETAKNFYLLGLDYQSRSEDKSYYLKALKQYEHAVEINSEYAQAWAQLSIIQSTIYSKTFDRSSDVAQKSWQAAIKSLQLQPDLALGHYALASWHYLITRDHQKALQAIKQAESDPALNSHVQLFKAAVLRRQGDFQQSLTIMEEALKDNSRTPFLADSLAMTYLMVSQYDNAIDMLKKASLFARERYQDTARLDYRSALVLYFKDANLAILLNSMNKIKLPENQTHILLFNVFEPAYQAILTSKVFSQEHIFENQNQIYPLSLLQAISLHLQQSQSKNKKALLVKAEQQLLAMDTTHDPRVMMSLATVFALTQRHQQALILAKTALEIYPQQKDAIGKMYLEIELLQIHALTGNKSEFENLKSAIMAKPSLLSYNWLKLDPIWQNGTRKINRQ